MKLFLDDIREPHRVYPAEVGWIVVRSFDEAVEVLESACRCPSHISFDHDLGAAHYSGDFSDYKTGYDFVKWIVERDIDAKGQYIPKDFTFRVHSKNPVGAANIRNYLTRYLETRNKD
jgi:hypothetical protein